MFLTPLIITLVFMVISMIVSSRLKSKFKEYSQVQLSKDFWGGDVAGLMLADHGITDVKVIGVEGQLTDHYNPAERTVNLSAEVYQGRNAAATAVAAHECGHAVQHAKAYAPLKLRSALVPVQSVSGKLMNFLTLAMMFGSLMVNSFFTDALLLIIACNVVFTLFALVTLPVEFDASSRALAWIQNRSIVTRQEHAMAKDALHWAAMTYVVAALAALANLAYYLMIFLSRRD